MPYAPTHPAPPLSDSTADHQARRSAALPVAAWGALAALGATVAGFVAVALALVGIGGASLAWGAGLCVGGWALAAALRERTADEGAG